MEELKDLAQVLKDLPHTAVWAIIAYLIYKLSVLASIYATIRFVVDKAADAYTAKVTKPNVVKFRNGSTINEEVAAALELQASRIGKGSYIHGTDVGWLSQVLDKALAERK